MLIAMKLKTLAAPLCWILGLLTLSAFLEKPAEEKFVVDTQASTLVWTAKKVTGSHTGVVKLAAGELALEGKALKRGSFDIDLTSITVTDITDPQSNAKLVGHLKGEDFFSVNAFPKATFALTSATSQAGTTHLVKGKLTIKGITNDVEFPASIVKEGKKLTATGKIVVDRTKYDIRYRSANFFENLGDKAIENEFTLDIKLVAAAQKGV
jgi:polyisoprenoid-binding protein YceI